MSLKRDWPHGEQRTFMTLTSLLSFRALSICIMKPKLCSCFKLIQVNRPWASRVVSEAKTTCSKLAVLSGLSISLNKVLWHLVTHLWSHEWSDTGSKYSTSCKTSSNSSFNWPSIWSTSSDLSCYWKTIKKISTHVRINFTSRRCYKS